MYCYKAGPKEAENSVTEVRQLLVSCLKSIAGTTRQPTKRHTVKTHQILDTPKLLEEILCNLNVRDLLSAIRVNHSISQMVTSSPRVQAAMQLRVAKSGHWSSLFVGHWSGFSLAVSLNDIPHVQGAVIVTARLENFKHNGALGWYTACALPKTPGALFRRMLICQPPMKEMTIRAKYCDDSTPRECQEGVQAGVTCGTIRSGTGITVGDFQDHTVRLIAEHSRCPNAHIYEHADDGSVGVDVHFEARLQLKMDDPYIASHAKENLKCEVVDKGRKLKKRRVETYIAAKRTGETRLSVRMRIRLMHALARDNGRAIPTFEDFWETDAGGRY